MPIFTGGQALVLVSLNWAGEKQGFLYYFFYRFLGV